MTPEEVDRPMDASGPTSKEVRLANVTDGPSHERSTTGQAPCEGPDCSTVGSDGRRGVEGHAGFGSNASGPGVTVGSAFSGGCARRNGGGSLTATSPAPGVPETAGLKRNRAGIESGRRPSEPKLPSPTPENGEPRPTLPATECKTCGVGSPDCPECAGASR